jgi:hypothetical protein
LSIQTRAKALDVVKHLKENNMLANKIVMIGNIINTKSSITVFEKKNPMHNFLDYKDDKFFATCYCL